MRRALAPPDERRITVKCATPISRQALPRAAAACAAVLALVLVACSEGTDVTVRNEGKTTALRVQLHVTGKAYDLGAIQPGAARSCAVTPEGDSHVEVEVESADGIDRRRVDVYMTINDPSEPINVVIDGVTATAASQDSRPVAVTAIYGGR